MEEVKKQNSSKVLQPKIKVCFVVSVDITLKFLLLSHSKFLQNRGYNVSAVCSPGKWIKDIERQGIKVKTIRFKRKFFTPIADLVALVRLFFYFRKEKFDIVQTFTLKPSLLGQIAAKMAGVPIIVNTVFGFYFHEGTPYFKRIFFIFIEKIAAKCSDLIFSINREDIKTAIKEKICSRELIKYLGYGINVDRFNSKRFSLEFIKKKKKSLGIDSSDKILGIVARLVKEKGYLELFEAFKKVLEKFPRTLLLIVGQLEPEKKDAIRPEIVKEYGIGKNVIFLGEREDVDEIYPLMDIFVLPSHREGLNVSLLEARSMQKPVVASDIRGCREAVEGGKTGVLVPVRNPEKLAKAIIYFLSNPKKAQEMGEKGREEVVKQFDEKMISGRILDEYERLMKK